LALVFANGGAAGAGWAVSSPSADPIYPDWSAARYHVALMLAVPKSPANQALAFLQRLPLLRALLPADAGTLHSNVSEVDRVRVLAPSRAPCLPSHHCCVQGGTRPWAASIAS
jgi:hypothetical protein